VVTALYGVSVVWPPVLGKYLQKHLYLAPKWDTHVPETAVAAVLAIVAAAVIWGWSRSWRMGLYMDDKGLTVRNYFRTYRFGWAEVTRFVDGSISLLNKGYWALSVLVADGRAVTVSGTASRSAARDDTLATIRQAAECHGIAGDLTGAPGDQREPKWKSMVPFEVLIILAYLFIASWFSVSGFHCHQTCGG
jgi:hypothetical protein